MLSVLRIGCWDNTISSTTTRSLGSFSLQSFLHRHLYTPLPSSSSSSSSGDIRCSIDLVLLCSSSETFVESSALYSLAPLLLHIPPPPPLLDHSLYPLIPPLIIHQTPISPHKLITNAEHEYVFLLRPLRHIRHIRLNTRIYQEWFRRHHNLLKKQLIFSPFRTRF